MNQREEADEFGYGTGGAVSHQLKRLREVMKKDKLFKKRVTAIERKIVRA